MHTYDDTQTHLEGLLHGVDIDDIDNLPEVFERASANMLLRIDPVDTMRTQPLSQTVHDDVFNYTLPSDFKEPIDLYPQSGRSSWDVAERRQSQAFDLKKALRNREVSIEANEGSKFIRINWRWRGNKVLHNMDSKTDNGTWAAITGASGVVLDNIYKVSSSGSIRFNLTATGGGIQNSDMDEVDLTDEDEVADVFVWVYLPSTSITSIGARWGSSTSAYWTPTAQTTQADGTPFRVGWNLIRFAWSSATETGTVDPSAINYFRLSIVGSTAINNIRVDNIIFSIGNPFDIKYYSKYIFKDSNGTWMNQPTTGSDIIVLDNDAFAIYLEELVIEASRQVESANAAGDIQTSSLRLNGNPSSPDPNQKLGLYAKYKKRYPSFAAKSIGSYGSAPARGRW